MDIALIALLTFVAGAVGIIHWFGDIWKMGLFRQGIRWRLIVDSGRSCSFPSPSWGPR